MGQSWVQRIEVRKLRNTVIKDGFIARVFLVTPIRVIQQGKFDNVLDRHDTGTMVDLYR